MTLALLDRQALKSLIDAIGQVVFVVEVEADQQFRFAAFNHCNEQRSGVSDARWAGRRPDEVLTAEQAAWVQNNYHHCVVTGREVSYEEFLQLPVGARWWRTILAPVYDGAGRVVRIFGTAVDITEEKARQRATEQREARYYSLFDHAPLALWEEDYSAVRASLARLRAGGVTDIPAHLRDHPALVWALLGQVRIVDVNRAALRMYAAPDKATLLRGLDQILPDPTGGFRQELEALAEGRESVCFDAQARSLRGEALEVRVTVLFRELGDDYRRVIVAVEDVTARNRAERARDEQNRWFRTTFHSIADAVVATDTDGRVLLLNPPAEELSGWSEAESRGRPVQEILAFTESLTGRSLPDPLQQALRQGGRVTLPELVLLNDRQGRSIPVRMSAAPIRGEPDRLLGAVMVVSRADERRPEPRHLLSPGTTGAHAAPLGRQLLESHLLAVLEAIDTGGPPCALLFLHLDRFTLVTEMLGHAASAGLLRQLVDTLRQRIRNSDVLVELDGQELAVLLHQCPLTQARQVAAELRQTVLDARLYHQGQSFSVGVTVTVVPVIDAGTAPGLILQTATAACATAREGGGAGGIQVVEPDSPAIRRRREELRHLTGLREAMDEDRLRLYGQPVQDRHGRVGYVELLIRLLDREGGVIAPGAFIPAAERYGLIGELDRWVIRQALARYRQWFPQLDTGIGINLSGLSLDDEALADFIEAELSGSGVPPARVHFEITETAAINHLANALQLIQRLRGLGCRFYLDDFGSGLSSFAYLKRLPVDGLKIDRSFVRDLRRDNAEYTFIHCFVQVARRLGLNTVAEGLEELPTLALLHELGVEWVQGYALGRPAPLPWTVDDTVRELDS